MAIDTNSQEFANAWRLVSESLLQFVQSGSLISNSDNSGGAVVDESTSIVSPLPIVANQEVKTKIATRYASFPIRQQDGSYILKNLKDEKQTASIFEITIYSDETCDIKVWEKLEEETFHFLTSRVESPGGVLKIEGNIKKEQCSIRTIEPGKGIKDGRSVRVIEPPKVEFLDSGK